MEKTKKPKSKEKYRRAWKMASQNMQNHPLTSKLPVSEVERWQTIAENVVRQFHRSSSAVEERNGCLSQTYHNGHSVTEKQLHALTVIHNHFIRRLDGKTAAMRLFGVEHPDLFTWLLNQMDALPLSRKSQGHAIANQLILLVIQS